MVKHLLEQLRTKVENAHGLSETTQAELLKLVADLARQTTGQTAHPAASQHGVNQLIDLVEGLEISHPDITGLVNRIATMLENIGI